MSSTGTMNPQQICEDFLRKEIRYNSEHHILPSESAVADRLLDRGIEMKHVYQELHEKLHLHPPALSLLLGLVLSAAAFWSPEKIQRARTARDDLTKTNHQIAKKAAELAMLLERRSDLHNTSGFSSDTHYHVCDVLEAASQHNYLFTSYVQDQVLALDAKTADTTATDPLTAAATAAVRASKADFFKALFAAIEENCADNYGRLPNGFKLSDRTLASLGNCALDLDPDDLVDDAYIKRFRQRERSGAK